jgi:hypothetical protein
MAIGTYKMIYRASGVIFSQAGFCLTFSEFHENAGKWMYELKQSKNYPGGAIHTLIQEFIEQNNLQYKVALITIQNYLHQYLAGHQ